jgi:hypothetical protein
MVVSGHKNRDDVYRTTIKGMSNYVKLQPSSSGIFAAAPALSRKKRTFLVQK